MKSASENTVAGRPSAATVRRRLLAWYRRDHRQLPWRAAPGKLNDPYAVLVSELMLQQTQVATVIPYYQRFMARWPTLADLARASEQEVLRFWQGLGYYSRARYLRAAARMVVEKHGGRFPTTVAEIRSLPGVGRYTAGAVASMALGRREPVVDGNVIRVLARLDGVREEVTRRDVREGFWRRAGELVPSKHPGDFNQALMELGATVCLPRGPKCEACPLAGACVAQRQGMAEELPRREARRPARAVTHHVVALRDGNRWLIERRASCGLWARMWQFPTWETPAPGITPTPGRGGEEDARPSGRGYGNPNHAPGSASATGNDTTVDVEAQVRQWLREAYALTVRKLECVGTFTHQTTHRRICFVVWRGELSAGATEKTGAGSWRGLVEMEALPMSNPQRQVRGMLRS